MQLVTRSCSSSSSNYTSPTLRIYAEGGTLVADFTNRLKTLEYETEKGER